MYFRRFTLFAIFGCAAGFVLLGPGKAQEQELQIEHADCDYFGVNRDHYIPDDLRHVGASTRKFRELTTTTQQVTAMMAAPGGNTSRQIRRQTQGPAPGSIDSFIWADFKKHNITPAPQTTDWEFIRRVTLDLTGRIPTPSKVVSFVSDTSYDKRSRLIEELMESPAWVDKFTMYFGDLYQNTSNRPSIGLNRAPEGRNAFYTWIRDSLQKRKPYNQMVTELISVSGGTSFTEGANNFLLNGFMTGGPSQDIMDSMTNSVFTTFMGMSHVNCLLCHNGRGHVDSLSLWASSVTRYQAWQLASFLSHTQISTVKMDATANAYWLVQDNTSGFTADYRLNTTTGNRPARTPAAGCATNQPCARVAPEYILNGNTPKTGENYRVALARNITTDFQFARATVNYMWAYFFGRGLVDPPDSFDPARLDPDNPPPAPWALQPSNPALLKALAEHFVASNYDLRALMKEIVNSDAYQLSSRYEGTWNPAWEPFFARKFVRRLWSEELHDAIAQSSGTIPTYTYRGFTDLGFPSVNYAMQLPDVVGAPSDGGVTAFLDAFLRGNRDDQVRKSEGSILQVLQLMNTTFVTNRAHAAGSIHSQLISDNLTRGNTDLINTLYLNILSRLPSSDELSKAQAAIPTATGTARTNAVQDLAWSLYNKVDFVFNY
jgi:hypothetical protein